jgi:hypothetical protein
MTRGFLSPNNRLRNPNENSSLAHSLIVGRFDLDGKYSRVLNAGDEPEGCPTGCPNTRKDKRNGRNYGIIKRLDDITLRKEGFEMRQLCSVLVVCSLFILLAGSYGLASDAVAIEKVSLQEVREDIASKGYTWTADHTSVSGLPEEDLQQLLGLRVPDSYYERLEQIRMDGQAPAPLDLPSSFSWTDSGGVSPVRYQRCGDCWAQCAVAMIESQMRIYDGDITRLSVQQAIDCNYGGSSCNGGWWGDVYDVHTAFGAVTQSCYPYQGSDGDCSEDLCEPVLYLSGWEYIDTTVTSIKTHLMSFGPIAVGVTVYNDLYYYSGGCYEHEGNDAVNHGVLIVGWDDSMCGGEGAWYYKNSWGTGWGINGYGWIKYGSCKIGEAAAIAYYNPREPVLCNYYSSMIDDSAGNGDGIVDPGETITLQVGIRNARWETATNVSAALITSTPGINLLTDSATFPDASPGSIAYTDPPHFSFSVDGDVACGTRIKLLMSIVSDQGSSTGAFDTVVGDTDVVLSDDCETDLGWSKSVIDDDATSGRWKRKNPVSSFADSILVQSEADHTPGLGAMCFVTANILRNLPPISADVDGGKTTLTSPVIDLSGYGSAELRYFLWYTNDTDGPADDVWTVDISNDSGATWVNLQTQSESHREWLPYEHKLEDYVTLTDRMLARFVASDYGAESVVEAAVDDIEITGCPEDLSGVEKPLAGDIPGQVELVGSKQNPFAGSTHIFYSLPERSEVTVAIYDATGRLTKQILNRIDGAGYHSALWDGRSASGIPAAPGVYFVCLDAGGVVRTAKVVLAR